MSIRLTVKAVPAGALAWARTNEPLATSDVFYDRSSDYRVIRDLTDGPPSHLIGGAGVGPRFEWAKNLYEALTGTRAGDFWGTPARDRYKRALIGGDAFVDIGEEFGPARFSTPAEAAEAAETIREVSERGGPHATRAELEEWGHVIEQYAFFFERYRPGEELFYYLY